MTIDELSYKQSIPTGLASKAKAKGIHHISRNNGNLGKSLLEIYASIEQAKHWDKLSFTEHILLEQKWTDLMLELLRIGNTRVMRSIRYRLREQSLEEDELENGI